LPIKIETSSISFVTLDMFHVAISIDVYEHSFHELTMEYSIFKKIHLSRVFPLFISTVGEKILKEEFNFS
jgi:hypothetical protein